MGYSSKEIRQQIDTAFQQAQKAKAAVRNAEGTDVMHSIVFCRGIDDALARFVGELESMLRVAEAFEAQNR